MTLSVLRISEKLEEYLRKIYPKYEHAKVSDLQSLAKGWETELFSFKFDYEKESKKFEEQLILRMYPGIDQKGKTEWEYKVLTSLFNVDYPVPKTHILELNEEVLGKPFIIMDRIQGEDMGRLFFAAVEDNDQETILSIVKLFCTLFVKLHNIEWQALPLDINDVGAINPYYFIDRKILNYQKIINQSEIHELQPILDWLIERKNVAYSKKISILHRDFHPHNIIFTEEGDAFVIDWPSCTIGDYREDLGWSLLLTYAYTNKEIRNKILEFYEKEQGSEVKNIEYFEIVAIFRRFSDIMKVFKFGAKESGMREEVIQQIKETAFHMKRIYELLEEITGIKIPELEEFIRNLDTNL